jgi:hypothetical protein
VECSRRHNKRRCQCFCHVVADDGQRNESRLAQGEQVVTMLVHGQRTKEQVEMLLCRRWVVDNATRASGSVVVAQVAGSR